jgi:Bardet-Biedl syndrome 1 protein
LQENNTQAKKSPWIHAWSDTVAGVEAYSQMIALCDLKDDGDYKLIVADLKGKFKVYMGTNTINSQKLPDKPTAITTFYDGTKKPMIPIIAIASGSTIYQY